MLVDWKQVPHLLVSVLILVIACVPAHTQTNSMTLDDGQALAAATRGLCKAKVAMIGEIATHGDGHTIAFKVALVEQLMSHCGFNAVFFEANQEEFIHLNQRLRSGDILSSDDLLTAVGGIWKFYREFQPLVPFLLTRAQSRRVVLGGLDDQLGQLGQYYSNVGMITELTAALPEQESLKCKTALERRIDSDYPEATPYSEADRSQIVNCLEAMYAATSAGTTSTVLTRQEQQEMIFATQRWVSRDFSSAGASMANRDRSMFQTFEWLEGRLPKRHKIIVWAATVHIAKQGDPAWGDHAGTNLGSLIFRKYGAQARSLGFSALGGSFRQGRGKFLEVPVASVDSVEAQAFRKSTDSAVYVGSKQLYTMGTHRGAFFYHSYQTLVWSDFLDSVVVFRTERPLTDMR